MSDAALPDAPLFSAVLRPHRSLGRRGAVLLVALVGLVWLAHGLWFLSLGAWPVFAFFGLDIALFVGLVWLNMRAARRREHIALSRVALAVDRYDPSGRRDSHSFVPLWTRFTVARHELIGVTRMALASRGRELAVGEFLHPAEKARFAEAFAPALAKARR